MPKHTKSEQAKINRKVSILRKEGVPKKQAIARAIKHNERNKK